MASDSGDHLKSGQLGIPSVTASTVANIGPGIDFYFGFGVIAATAGVAAPLTILAATVAVALLAFTVAEFTRAAEARQIAEHGYPDTAGASVTTVAHDKTTSHLKSGTANSQGKATVPYDMSGATMGYKVVVDVTVSHASARASRSTSFTPA